MGRDTGTGGPGGGDADRDGADGRSETGRAGTSRWDTLALPVPPGSVPLLPLVGEAGEGGKRM